MRKVEVQLEDDLTGGPADETVRFGVDGTTYELDLSTKHANDLRHRLAPFIERARAARPRRGHGAVRTAASRERSRQIRAWAEEQGFEVAEHGRLPADVIRQYEMAVSGSRTVASKAETKPRRGGRRSSVRGSTRQARALGAARHTARPTPRRPAPSIA